MCKCTVKKTWASLSASENKGFKEVRTIRDYLGFYSGLRSFGTHTPIRLNIQSCSPIFAKIGYKKAFTAEIVANIMM